jgi:hypothetical protein
MLENKEIFSNKLIREVSGPGHNYSVSNNTFGAHIDDCNIRVLTSEEKDFRIKLLANDLQIRDDKLDLLDLSLRDAADEITNLNRTISNLMGQYEAEQNLQSTKKHTQRQAVKKSKSRSNGQNALTIWNRKRKS